MIERSYYNASARDFVAASEQTILGALTGRSSFAVDPQQRDAWVYTIKHLQGVLPCLDGAHVFLEFTIPRMGRRVDAIVIYRGILFVLEYKVGEADFSTSAIDQAVGYALDLKNFHEASHDRTIVPIVVATRTADHAYEFTLAPDGVAGPLRTNGQQLAHLIS